MTNDATPTARPRASQLSLPERAGAQGVVPMLPVGAPGHLLPAQVSLRQTLVRLAESLLLGGHTVHPHQLYDPGV